MDKNIARIAMNVGLLVKTLGQSHRRTGPSRTAGQGMSKMHLVPKKSWHEAMPAMRSGPSRASKNVGQSHLPVRAKSYSVCRFDW